MGRGILSVFGKRPPAPRSSSSSPESFTTSPEEHTAARTDSDRPHVIHLHTTTLAAPSPRYRGVYKWLSLLSITLLCILLVIDATKPGMNCNQLFTRDEWRRIMALVNSPDTIPALTGGTYGDNYHRTDVTENDFVFGDYFVNMKVRPRVTTYPEWYMEKRFFGGVVCAMMVVWIMLQPFIGV